MKRIFALFATAAATLALGGAALASPTPPDMELTVTPDNPHAGGSVQLQAYVHFGTKPVQGSAVQFVVTGPGLDATTIDAKPGEAGYYRAQFTPRGSGDFQIVTKVDGIQISPKPYHLQVTAAATDWTPVAAGALGLGVLGLGALLFRKRAFARLAPATQAR